MSAPSKIPPAGIDEPSDEALIGIGDCAAGSGRAGAGTARRDRAPGAGGSAARRAK